MSKGSYEEVEQTPQLLENEYNQAGIQGIQGLMGQPAPQVNLQGLGAEGQQLLGGGMNIIQQLMNMAKNPMENPAYALGLGEIEKILKGGYDPRTSPYYEGISKEAEMMTGESVKQLRHGQQIRGTLPSTVGATAEGQLRATADAKTLQTLGGLYESERDRMSNAISQALGYANYTPNLMGTAMSGISAMSPLATYGSDVANQQSITNAQLQGNWLSQLLQGYGMMSDYGTYYTNPITYKPGFWDYIMGGAGAIGSIIK